MKIAVIQETFHPFMGGSAKRYLEVCKRLVRRGHEIHLYTIRLSKNWPEFELINGIHVHRITTGRLITPTGFRYISDVLKFTIHAFRSLNQKDFDLYHVDQWPLFHIYATYLIAKMRKKPMSATYHECWYKEWFKWAPNRIVALAGIACESLVTRIPDLIICESNLTKERLIKHFKVSGRIEVISSGIDVDLFNKISVPKMPYRIVYVGRLNPHKKVDVLLIAFSEVKSKYPEASLEIIGDGPQRHYLERLAEKLGIKDVVFRGILSDEAVAIGLKRGWVHVLPSVREGQGVALLEALAGGTPSIVVNVKGCNCASSEVVRNYNCGLLASPNPSSIAEKISLLFTDDHLWARLRENGSRWVKNLDWESVTDQHEKIYHELCQNFVQRK